MKRVIHWFRRDLRITDNTALMEAASRAEEVIPVFILEDALKSGPDVGASRLAFLLKSVEALRESLAQLGYALVVRSGRSEEVLPAFCREVRAEAVFCNRRYEPYSRARDNRICLALQEMGVGFEVFKDAVIWEEEEIVTKSSGKPFTVFTPYSKAWLAKTIPPPRPRLRTGLQATKHPQTETIPLNPEKFGHSLRQSLPPAGEKAAQNVLKHFLGGPVFEYGAARNFPAVQGTSQLSPHLRCGTIGIRTVLEALAAASAAAPPEARAHCDVFRKELIWREFYLQVLCNFPHVMKGSFKRQYDKLRWSDNQQHLEAWCAGQTGYPIVDAAMRCLNATGWMHNRLRMVVAMFLTKDLLLNWQQGERYFMQQLVDGDLGANNGGWQWSAGTGTDAAPYFRIFNPTEQSRKFDPQGEFIREWIPELEKFPDEAIHQPGSISGPGKRSVYPAPIVDHGKQRVKCLAMYRAVKT